jgi:hypothetical protein
MGIHNELRRGPFSRATKAALGDTTAEGGVERYGETMQPVLDLWARDEFGYLRSEYLFGERLQKGADVANCGVCGIALSNSCKLVAAVWASGANSTANGSLSIEPYSRDLLAALGGAAQGNPAQARDSRNWSVASGGPVPSDLQFWTALTGAPGLNARYEQLNFPDSEIRPFFGGPWILRPGAAIIVQTEAINQVITVNFWGWVRSALNGELSI